MATYIARRIAVALAIMLATSFVIYILVSFAGDPLEDLRTNPAPNRDELMAKRIELLNLDTHPVLRYFGWLGGAAGCLAPGVPCDLGNSLDGQPVTEALGSALVNTLRMVVAATLLSILLGTTVGIITALRQYTTFDYGTTFTSFLFFSLPVFWVAVLLKEFGAIGFNTFLSDPTISVVTSLVMGVIIGLVVAGAVGGTLRQKAINVGIAAVASLVVFQGMSLTGWLKTPSLGMGLIAVLGAATAVGITALIAGLRNRRALYSSLAVVGVGLVLYLPIQMVLNQANFWILVVLSVVTVAGGVAIGHYFGGYDRGQNRAVAGLTAFVVGLLIVLDKFMLYWPLYSQHSRVKGRPIATLGASTPGFNENFWMNSLDAFTHVLLPTLALMLVGFATYARYSRATMLEVMNQDYIRTARAKGLSERVVVVRHGFRNALVPIATVVAMSIGAMVGGAIITERIFSWSGMGTLFFSGLTRSDPNPIMAVFLVTSLMTMTFIIIADLTYSFLDPRVRVK